MSLRHRAGPLAPAAPFLAGGAIAPPPWLHFSHSHLPSLEREHSSRRPLHPMMLTRQPSLLLASTASLVPVVTADYQEPFPHSVTEWRER